MTREGGRTVFETPWFSIVELLFQGDPDASYYCISRSDGVICLVLTEAGDLVLVRQMRPPLARATLEMPAGGIDEEETPEQAAEREILEETGCQCTELVYVTPLRLMINREDVVEHFFIGVRARPIPGLVAEERIDVVHVSRSELRDQVLSGRYDQSVALSGIYIAEQRFGFRFFEDSTEHILSRLTGKTVERAQVMARIPSER